MSQLYHPDHNDIISAWAQKEEEEEDSEAVYNMLYIW